MQTVIDHMISISESDSLQDGGGCACRCYPTKLLGTSPHWYRSRSYRARVVCSAVSYLHLSMQLRRSAACMLCSFPHSDVTGSTLQGSTSTLIVLLSW